MKVGHGWFLSGRERALRRVTCWVARLFRYCAAGLDAMPSRAALATTGANTRSQYSPMVSPESAAQMRRDWERAFVTQMVVSGRCEIAEGGRAIGDSWVAEDWGHTIRRERGCL